MVEVVSGYKKKKSGKLRKPRKAPKEDPYKYCQSCHLYEKKIGCLARWCLPEDLRIELVRNCINSSAVPYTRRPKSITIGG